MNNQYTSNEGDILSKQWGCSMYLDPFKDISAASQARLDLGFNPDFCVGNFLDFRNNFEKIVEPIDEIIDSVYVVTYGISDDGPIKLQDDSDEYVYIESHFSYNDGKYDFTSVQNSENFQDLCEGRWFSKKELYESSDKCFVSEHAKSVIGKSTLAISGKEYKIIGYQKDNESYYFPDVFIPFYSLPDDVYLSSFYIYTTRPLLKSEYDALSNNMRELVSPDLSIKEYYTLDINEKSVLKTMNFISILLAVISAITIAYIYSYLLNIREKTTAIYRICGAKYFRTAFIYAGEMIINLSISMGIGCLFFRLVEKVYLEKKYSWFFVIYGNGVSYKLVLIYCLIVIFLSTIFILLNLKKTPIQLLRKLSRS